MTQQKRLYYFAPYCSKHVTGFISNMSFKVSSDSVEPETVKYSKIDDFPVSLDFHAPDGPTDFAGLIANPEFFVTASIPVQEYRARFPGKIAVVTAQLSMRYIEYDHFKCGNFTVSMDVMNGSKSVAQTLYTTSWIFDSEVREGSQGQVTGSSMVVRSLVAFKDVTVNAPVEFSLVHTFTNASVPSNNTTNSRWNLDAFLRLIIDFQTSKSITPSLYGPLVPVDYW